MLRAEVQMAREGLEVESWATEEHRVLDTSIKMTACGNTERSEADFS